MKQRITNRKRTREEEAENDDIDSLPTKKQKTTPTTHKYWKMMQSYTLSGYWQIHQLLVSPSSNRIGVILSRRNYQFKVMIIETNMLSVNNERFINSNDKEIWCKEGRISSLNQIALNDELTVCIIAYDCDVVEVFKIRNNGSISKETISVRNGPYVYDPHIAALKIFDNNIVLITKRGMIFRKPIMKNVYIYTKGGHENINHASIENGIYCSKQNIVTWTKSRNKNELIVLDADGTNYDIKPGLNHLETNSFQSIIADNECKTIIVKSNEKIHCLAIDKTKRRYQANDDFFNVSNNLNGSVNININAYYDSWYYQSYGIFEEEIISDVNIDGFINDDTFIGHNRKSINIWRIFNDKETKQDVLCKSTTKIIGFSEDICGIIADFISNLPQKLMISFVKKKNKKLFHIEGFDFDHGFVILYDDEDNETFVFVLDYAMILNVANTRSGVMHKFMISLSKLTI